MPRERTAMLCNNGLTSDRTSMARRSWSGSTEAMETGLSGEMQHRLATIVMVLLPQDMLH
ncbi:hypothetical protein AC629_21115 [Bradyrhizobium sp. NAS80.1]|uniref:hypothetical protein n=1 Tax=Bradyrhizobium sp. NAS80.1 TaxID=1680159 RepID=UPI00095A7767|nr:hypothetical protein [Bradyrhizobium sp. NAS80.1]OKO84587.1 hypothetical protein AC629_21115 [Bradyrhizobium sp. NAS80.1]